MPDADEPRCDRYKVLKTKVRRLPRTSTKFRNRRALRVGPARKCTLKMIDFARFFDEIKYF